MGHCSFSGRGATALDGCSHSPFPGVARMILSSEQERVSPLQNALQNQGYCLPHLRLLLALSFSTERGGSVEPGLARGRRTAYSSPAKAQLWPWSPCGQSAGPVPCEAPLQCPASCTSETHRGLRFPLRLSPWKEGGHPRAAPSALVDQLSQHEDRLAWSAGSKSCLA